MKITRHPIGYNYKRAFPKLKLVLPLEGEAIFKAKKKGKYYLIVDSGSMAGILDEDEVIDLVSVNEFDSEEECDTYFKEHYDINRHKPYQKNIPARDSKKKKSKHK